MKSKTFFILPIIALLTIIAALAFLLFKKEPGEKNGILPSLPEKSKKAETATWEEIEKAKAPSSYEIEGIDFIGGDTGCCLCAAFASAYKYMGGADSDKLLSELLLPAENRDVKAIMKIFEKFGLKDKIHIGYYYQGKTTEERPAMLNFFNTYLENPEAQVKMFESEEKAFEALKKLIYSDVPTVVAAEDVMEQRSPQQEIQDNTFYLITGYNKGQIIAHMLPGIRSTDPLTIFKQKWQLQDTIFKYGLIPGNYTIIFLPQIQEAQKGPPK